MSDLLGQTLVGRYRVERFLGEGGMARVYKVWDDARAAYLAMKLLRGDFAEDRDFLRRFQKEAETLAVLQHPNIVRFYGLEQHQHLVFMLMDYVEGTTLRRLIFNRDGALDLKELLVYLDPISAALHFAHAQGVIHCDVKPGNVLINQRGSVLVTDFGVARIAETSTVTLTSVGTPAYMSPEQCRGQELSPATDVYALGITLFEMVTGGERPFVGDISTLPGPRSERVRWEQIYAPPPSPRHFNPALPASVEQVILKCLAKRPEMRWEGPLAVLEALQQAVDMTEGARLYTTRLMPDKPPVARDDDSTAPLSAFDRSGRSGAAMRSQPTLVLLALLIGLFVGVVGFEIMQPKPFQAAAPFVFPSATASAYVPTLSPSPNASPTASLAPTEDATQTAAVVAANNTQLAFMVAMTANAQAQQTREAETLAALDAWAADLAATQAALDSWATGTAAAQTAATATAFAAVQLTLDAQATELVMAQVAIGTARAELDATGTAAAWPTLAPQATPTIRPTATTTVTETATASPTPPTTPAPPLLRFGFDLLYQFMRYLIEWTGLPWQLP